MTSNALTRKVKSLAEKNGLNPGFSLRCINAAEKLAVIVKPEDTVLWSAAHGGLAWDALGLRKGRRTGAVGTVYCVLPDGFPDTPELWRRIDSAARETGSEIRRIRLSVEPEAISAGDTSPYPPLILRVLKYLFPDSSQVSKKSAPDESAPDESTTEKLYFDRPETSSELESAGGEPVRVSHSKSVHIESAVDLQERFLAARAVLAAGMKPSVSLAAGESYEAALLSSRYFPGDRNVIIRISEDWDAVAAFQIQTTMPILTPASEEDLAGALVWAAESTGPVLIIEPGRKSLPPRTVFKKSWSGDPQIVVKDKIAGKAGRILFVVAGTLAREASKAAERLAKENFSVSVLSIRILKPLEISEIKNFIKDFDLVVVADPIDCPGGLKTSLGLDLLRSGVVPAVVSDSSMTGLSLAELASSAHRENRFLQTVDDVKKDRWR